MACKDCYNGCAEITSDKCVKYTGPTIEELGIENGDSLYDIEKSITDFLLTVLDGSGIIPDVNVVNLCELITKYLPCWPCTEVTLNDYLNAIIKAACELDVRLGVVETGLEALESSYTIDCLTVIPSSSSNTHNVVQAVILELCELRSDFENLLIALPNTYVALEDLNDLIAAYLASLGSGGGSGGTGINASKMVPYTAVEYYGPLSNFAADGSGIGDWEKIYLCNGLNGTPDKRGRVGVGATTMPGGAFHSAVDPATGNPVYDVRTVRGENDVILTSVNQIPSHTHIADPTVTVASHTHLTVGEAGNEATLTETTPISYSKASGGNNEYTLRGSDGVINAGITSTGKDTVEVSVVNSSVGGIESHNNIQPVMGCYYIMYIPS